MGLVERYTSWIGGPIGLVLIVTVQLLLVGMIFVDPRVSVALVMSAIAVVVVLERPLLGVGLLIGARLLSTGATVFLRIGSIGIGLFEPALLLCLVGLIFHATVKGKILWREWPWRAPYLVMMCFVMLTLAWSVDVADGLGELLPMGMVLANCLVILVFVRTFDDFKLIMWCWIGTCVLIGFLALASSWLGIELGVSFQAASGGGRETGLGQQPNWFAMNLMFVIHSCFGMALLQRSLLIRFGLMLGGLFVFFMMLKSGSRGSAYATLIGGVLVAMAHPLFRRWFLRFAALTVVIFAVGISFDVMDSSKALTRIGSNVTLQQNYRQLNWLVCFQMFQDTMGLGIGAGGYTTLLPQYNGYVSNSLYDYPHGIFWQTMAHYGVIGILIMTWLVISVVRMARELIRMAKGTEAEIFAWTMPAAMVGYIAWSFVEFTINDKPFWEFLALYTALYLVVKRMTEEGESLPAWLRPSDSSSASS
jgi:hypothetical protein